MREYAAQRILLIFFIGNVTVLTFLAAVFGVDWWLMANKLEAARERIIDSGVVKALIGATTVQVGALMVTIVGYLFPRRGSGSSAPRESSRPHGKPRTTR